MIKAILLTSLIVMALVVTQQVKAESEQDKIDALTKEVKDVGADIHNKLSSDLAKLRSCHGAENVTKCKMNVLGLSDRAAIFVLGLNNSKVNK